MGAIAAIFTGLSTVSSLVTGMFGTINGITKALADEKINARNAQTAEEKIHSEERISMLQARRDVLIGEAGSGSRLNLIVRSLFALGPLSVVLKLYFWDKVIGSLVGCSQAPAGTCGMFTTDPLDENGWKVMSVVLGFYFVSEITLGVTRMVKSK
jgi:hypothetical protein